MTQQTDSAKSDAASFESELAALEGLVKTLEQGDVPLAEAMQAFEQGLEHAQACEKLLAQAQSKLDELSGEVTDASAEPQ
nr:exodeoxyribonuclease VII small subunit [Oceanococcus sp. HetDA_MAG_MS8]